MKTITLDKAVVLGARTLRRNLTENLYIHTGINMTMPGDIRATLTERCNYRCVYCDYWRKDSYPDEMDLHEWQQAFLSIRSFIGRFSVQFLGGEPMLWMHFLDLVEFCRDAGIDWGVITNGSSLSAARVERLVAAQPLNVDVSIDGRTPASHDRARGVRNSLMHVSAGVERLVAARSRHGQSFVIRIKPTVHRHNLHELNELVDWVETLPGVTIDFSPVRLWRDSDVAALYPSTLEEMTVLRQEVDELLRRKQAGAPIETSVAKLEACVRHFESKPVAHGVSECRVGLRSIDIRPNGDVDHCSKYNRIGSLRNQSMAEIWNAAERRETVKATVSCDRVKTGVCATACTTHRSLVQEARRGIQMLRLNI